MELFMHEIRAADTRPGEYQVKLFGGGNMFPEIQKERRTAQPLCTGTLDCGCRQVSCKNSRTARLLVTQYGFNIAAEHLGDTGHRQIIFDVGSGHVWVKHNPIISVPECMREMVS